MRSFERIGRRRKAVSVSPSESPNSRRPHWKQTRPTRWASPQGADGLKGKFAFKVGGGIIVGQLRMIGQGQHIVQAVAPHHLLHGLEHDASHAVGVMKGGLGHMV